jgi:hypothetical protein
MNQNRLINGRTTGAAEAPDTAGAFSIGWHALGRRPEFTLLQNEQGVLWRPARLGLSSNCGLTPSIAASASPY